MGIIQHYQMKDHKYPINDIYYTIQGEGCMTGVPAIFVRFHGCPVGCHFCDTKETWYFNPDNEMDDITDTLGANPKYHFMSGSVLSRYLQARFTPDIKWIVITGGEPAQYPLKPLVTALHEDGYKVAIETSGTEIGHLNAGFDWVTISPKLNQAGGRSLDYGSFARCDELKHVIGKQSDITDLQNILDYLENYQIAPKDMQICLQPMSQSKRATELCIQTAKERGWRLSIQTHKYIQIP